MENDLPKNALVGTTSGDTLANLSAVMMLLRYLNFSGDINKDGEYGLFVIHTLIQDSLEFEIKRMSR